MNNEVSFTSDPFNVWLFENQWIVPFVQFDSPNNLNDTQTRQIKLAETISKIKNFREFRLLSSAPEKPHFPQLSLSLIPSSVFRAHKHFFLQSELYDTRCESYQISIKRTDSLLEALAVEQKITNAMLIVFDEEALFRYLLTDSDKSISIAEADSIIVSQISADDLILTDVNSQANVLLHIITGMKPNYDRRALFLFDHPFQEKFDQLFYHSDFKFHDDIERLFTEENMSSPDVFTNSTVLLMQQMSQFFKLTESTEISIFSLIYFRAVYNYAMSFKPSFFFPEIECKFNLLESLREIVAKSEKLTRASRQLTSLAFHITPLDLLAAVHTALTELRLFVCEGPDNDDAQSFDTIFGLFLVVLVASDLPNQEQIFRFILDFAPPDGLSGPFEYARATVSAASVQCQAILDELTKEEK
ncbi:hypothetical protein M9Y10_010617 [Tritrichomonas musculus]|uniref:VPS9 domain-containing protein n=1 Tax=Tritrichomonas musculus TaxID=1915356 RepID=A0ABR2IMJ2_9EUKA